MDEQRKSLVMSLARAVVGGVLALALICWTLKSTDADLWGELAVASKSLLTVALLIYGFVLAIAAVRWRVLLAVQDVHLPFRSVARLVMIGMFFNICIPGAVGGDLVKMACIMKQAPDKKAEAALTILLDRVIGLLGLFVVAGLMVLACLNTLLALEHTVVRNVGLVVGLGSVGGVVAIILVEIRQWLFRHPWLARLVAWASPKIPGAVLSMLQRLVAALELYRRHRRRVVAALALSVAVHTCLGLQLLAIGRSFHERRLRGRDYMLTTQVANVVASVPVTPGGVGTRDLMTKTMFEAFGATSGKTGAIPVTLSLIIVFWAMAGAGTFILSGNQLPRADAASSESPNGPASEARHETEPEPE